MAVKRQTSRRSGTQVACKVLFDYSGRPIGVEDAEGKRVEGRALASVRPTVKAIEVPLEVVHASDKKLRWCYVHIRCRLYQFPCPGRK
jgi:hypothetical protein